MRIGLIGAGAVADYHIAAALELPNASISAVCDIDAVVAQRAAAAAGGASSFTDYRDMIDSGTVDAVIVNTPHSFHLPMVTDAARAGLHVLVEKPMATTLDDCDAMIAACDTAGVALTVGHIQHFMPDKVAAKEHIDSGELGDVVMVRDFRSTDYRPGTRSGWFFSPTVAGGGALINIGGHCIDRSLWFGGGRAERVLASTVNRFSSEVETDGTIALRLANGIGASINVISDPPLKADSLFIVCERGVVVADPRSGTLVQVDGRSRVLHERHPDDIQHAFTAQLADFLDVINGGRPTVPLSHARHVVEVVLESYRSAAEGVARTVGAAPVVSAGAR
ncbi:Gfo/Idh/MocA family protein [Paramicrobacterium chengjingii]|uniref:Gfo/Idh/MocA family oxidoreductase n=1 Tax=Paramicrobacterium chengjingii TaxID=2769067 RepID=A0ABX6YH58_9MICO|nr:Gfo/Idh/MocA family oxidoreductase [Microbacterium chengjingii]QPZ38030.1 Gfo/Idh/MocA family oxidoreductase [Microbacterium chengjingii]